MNTCLGIKSENAPEKSTFSIAINYNDYSQQVNEYLREAKDCLNDYTKKYSHSKFLPCQSYGVLCKMASNEKGEKSDFFFTIVHFNKSNNLTVFTWFDPNTTKFNVLDTAVEYHRKSLLNVFDLGQLNETVPTSIKYFSNPSKHILFVVSEFTNLNLQYISLIEDKLGKANSIIPSYIFVCTYGQKDHQVCIIIMFILFCTHLTKLFDLAAQRHGLPSISRRKSI